MTEDSRIKELERKAFASYFKDGLWDIYGALLFIGFGVSMLTDWDYIMAAFAVLAVVLLFVRRRIIVPRLGQVRFSPERQTRTRRSKQVALVTLTFTALLGVVFFALYSTNNVPGWLDIWMEDYFFATFGGVQAILVAAAAHIVGVRRFYAYAVLIFVSFVISGVLRSSDMEAIPILTAGGVVLVFGVAQLAHFLHKYPIAPRETGDAQEQ